MLNDPSLAVEMRTSGLSIVGKQEPLQPVVVEAN
jgi:hypothetical protein